MVSIGTNMIDMLRSCGHTSGLQNACMNMLFEFYDSDPCIFLSISLLQSNNFLYSYALTFTQHIRMNLLPPIPVNKVLNIYKKNVICH